MASDESNGVKRFLWSQGGSVVVAVLFQSAVLIWWAACMTTRLNYVERDLTTVSQRVYQLEIDKP